MSRGQTAFEYLLIIGGSVLLSAVVLVFVHGNLGTISPSLNAGINRLSAGVGMSCSDCDAAFVNEGQPKSVTEAMLADDVIIGGTGTWTQTGSNQYSAVSGNVGIGTTNPTSKLTVNGTINASGNKVTGLAAPIDTTDAATKAYVDAAGGGTYSTCYVFNLGTAGYTCASGYKPLVWLNQTTMGLNFDPSVAATVGGAFYVTIGGQMLAASMSWGTNGGAPPILYDTNTNTWNIGATCGEAPRYGYLTTIINGYSYQATAASCVGTTVTKGTWSFALCCK